jgi:excisionase family DNA binding protein
MDRTLFIEDAAALLGVSRRTVYYRIREGRLQTIKTRCGSQRVLLSSLEALAREVAEKRNARRELST